MKYIETDIKGVWIIEPKVFDDARGYFMEAWKKEEFEAHVGMVDFVQDNESKSSYGRAYTKVIKMVKSPKTGAYVFDERMVPNEAVKDFFKK